jgi:DNA polymerase-3 subunit delta'
LSGGGDGGVETRHPRETFCFYGHREAETTLLETYRGGRMPHAWLIGGPPGIGKATLAYRMARFVLAHPDPAADAVRGAASLAVSADHPVARAVAMSTHGGLLVLERTAAEKGGLRASIVVDQVRETVPFFGATAAVAGWRVCIVDVVDELKWPEAPNALLKILEEPPPRALFLLVSHTPARVLPTIRSRCRMLVMRELELDDVIAAAADASGTAPGDPALRCAAESADGSVARALMFLGGGVIALQDRIRAALDALPALDWMALHAIGDALAPGDRAGLAVFADLVNRWLGRKLDANLGQPAHAAAIAEAWDHLNQGTREADALNLDRKPLVFSIFARLADLARDRTGHVLAT